jgi:hypothetical protein
MPKPFSSNMHCTSDHMSTSKFFFISDAYESTFEEIRYDKAILPAGDVGVTCQLDRQQTLVLMVCRCSDLIGLEA